ncbi:conserved hypothetical protein [Aspergillus fumigatus A1163]|uniref:Uncharacterized protein n=1 Tax=Aspergillus fumigatus (strain CBS 144.89 / FGSC A1163 / CEA10) TaxID=451804 RepID=B0YDI9_ASPFC|nr:conserved hypothetical protein [Aspergillus fumigatus A1163]
MVENKFIKVDRESFPYVFVKDVDISLKTHEKGLAQVDWPIPDTQYTKFFLTPKQTLLQISDILPRTSDLVLPDAHLGSAGRPSLFGIRRPQHWRSPATYRYISPFSAPEQSKSRLRRTISTCSSRCARECGREASLYTGTMGNPVPIMKGWLRVSLREVNENHPFHCDYLPHRDYASADVQPVKAGEKY